MKSKITALFLSFMMLFSAFPVFAAGSGYFFEDSFDNGDGMWNTGSGVYVTRNSEMIMPVFGATGDSLFSQATLANVTLQSAYEIEFRMKIASGACSGIMITDGTDNFSLIFRDTDVCYLPGGANMYIAKLSNYPSGFTFTENDWLDVRLKVEIADGWNKPTVQIKKSTEFLWKTLPIDYNLSWLGVPTNAKLSLRSQGNRTEYDFVKIKNLTGSTNSKTEPSVTAVSTSSASKALYVGESYVAVAEVTGDKKGYYTEWTVQPEGVVEIQGTDNFSRTIHALSAGVATVTVNAAGKASSFTVTVDNNPSEKKTVNMKISDGRKISDTFYGINDVQAWEIGRRYDHTPEYIQNALDDVRPWNIRGPGGIDGNYFLSLTGDLYNKHYGNLSGYYGQSSSQFDNLGLRTENGVRPGNYPSLTFDDIFEAADRIGSSYIYNMNIFSQTTEEIVQIVGEIKKYYSGDIMIEMGNEVYDIPKYAPTLFNNAKAYIDRAKEVSNAIKAKYPDVKIGIVIVPPDVASRSSNPLYTLWNTNISKDKSYYDAVIPHIYEEINSTRETQSYYLQNSFGYTVDTCDLIENLNSLFADKEIWITEWGNLPKGIMASTNYSERARRVIAKSPGAAITYIDRLLSFMENESITATSYYTVHDNQGFGLVQGDTKLPEYYAFSEIGDIFAENKYYYPITSSDISEYTVTTMTHNKTPNVKEIGLWGFGDVNGVKQVVAVNRSNKAIMLKTEDKALAKTWEYGGISTNFPNHLNRECELFTDAPEIIPAPITYSPIYNDEIEIAPYSMVVMDIGEESILDGDWVKVYDKNLADVMSPNGPTSSEWSMGTSYGTWEENPDAVKQSFDVIDNKLVFGKQGGDVRSIATLTDSRLNGDFILEVKCATLGKLTSESGTYYPIEIRFDGHCFSTDSRNTGKPLRYAFAPSYMYQSMGNMDYIQQYDPYPYTTYPEGVTPEEKSDAPYSYFYLRLEVDNKKQYYKIRPYIKLNEDDSWTYISRDDWTVANLKLLDSNNSLQIRTYDARTIIDNVKIFKKISDTNEYIVNDFNIGKENDMEYSVNLNISNVKSESNAKLYTAVYKLDGEVERLVNVETESIWVDKGYSDNKSKTVTLPSDGNNYAIKAFIWSENMCPYADLVEYR